MTELSSPFKGKGFLASSHFKIGYDRRMSMSATKRSSFKKDFTAHEDHRKAEACKPPEPAEVMHSDLTFKPIDSTVTQESYPGKYAPKIIQCKALTKTNFKMGSDKRIDSFHTTHSFDFHPPSSGTRSFPMANPMKSYVPQGDPQKEAMPISDYKKKYIGHDTASCKTSRAPCMHTGGPCTIPGDNRTHGQFSTSMSKQFPGVYLPYIAVKPNLTGSDIPSGDLDKVIYRETTQLCSFSSPDKLYYKRYPRDKALYTIGSTNFKIGHDPKMDRFETNAMDSFSSKEATKPVLIISRDSNASSFPEGDRHPERVRELVTSTNYSFHHKPPQRGIKHVIVCGADKRTSSKVTFGEPSRKKEIYSTTQSDDYSSAGLHGGVTRASGHPSDSRIPLDYYPDGHYTTTTVSEYPPWRNTTKRVIPIGALNELRQSSISPPLHHNRYFDTTNLTSYTAKRGETFHYDSCGLQRSSIPLGTMMM